MTKAGIHTPNRLCQFFSKHSLQQIPNGASFEGPRSLDVTTICRQNDATRTRIILWIFWMT